MSSMFLIFGKNPACTPYLDPYAYWILEMFPTYTTIWTYAFLIINHWVSHSSGVFLGCKIRGVDFCSMQKFSLTMQKFLKPIFWTFQKLWISNVVQKNEFWQRWQKILRLQKIFLIMQKVLHDAAKITFCSPERPG